MGLISVEYGLTAVLAAVLLGPLLVQRIQRNLEAFLFLMGGCAAAISQSWHIVMIEEAIQEQVVVGIMLSVIAAGLLAHYGKPDLWQSINSILLDTISLKVIFLEIVVVLGLLAAIITPILSLFLLVEAVNHLPIHRRTRTLMTISGCISILMGAALSLAEEPSSAMAGMKVHGMLPYAGPLPHEVQSLYLIFAILAVGLASTFISKAESTSLEGAGLVKASSCRKIALSSARACLFVVSLLLIGVAFGVNT